MTERRPRSEILEPRFRTVRAARSLVEICAVQRFLCKHTASQPLRPLFVAQCDEGIDARGAAGGEQRSDQADREEEGHNGKKSQWIRSRDA